MVYKWLFSNQYCALCSGPAVAGADLCSPCEQELPWLGPHCRCCALPLPAEGLLCGECQRHPPHFDRVLVAWRFGFPVDALINRFKHQADWPGGRLLAERLVAQLTDAYASGQPRPDCLLPVPLASGRLRERGFNQAQMLADWLGKALDLPVDSRSLRRSAETLAQQGLDAAARRRNLRQAFALTPNRALPGHVALVDDVLTTGATAEAIARVLKRAGVQRVDVYCLARTPKPG